MSKKKFERKKPVEPEIEEEIDLGGIVSDLKAEFKSDRFYTLDDEEAVNRLEVPYWVKVPSPLEPVLGGAGGIPCGLVTIFQGVSDSGKTTAAIECMISTQKDGGIGVICLTEPKFSLDRALDMGIKKNALILIKAKTVEEGEDKLAKTIQRIRVKYPEKPITLVWDSLGYSKCKLEIESKKHNNMWKASALKTMLGTLQIWLDDDKITFIGINHTYTNQQGRKTGGGGQGVKLAGAMIFDFAAIGKIRIDGYVATKDFDYADHEGNAVSFVAGEEVPKDLVLGVTGDKTKKGMKRDFKAENIEKS